MVTPPVDGQVGWRYTARSPETCSGRFLQSPTAPRPPPSEDYAEIRLAKFPTESLAKPPMAVVSEIRLPM